MTVSDALPVVPASALPAAVRNGSKADQETYRAALGFEKLLAGQLVETMAEGAGLADGPQAATVQEAFTDALTTGGGLGLAARIYASIKAAQA